MALDKFGAWEVPQGSVKAPKRKVSVWLAEAIADFQERRGRGPREVKMSIDDWLSMSSEECDRFGGVEIAVHEGVQGVVRIT